MPDTNKGRKPVPEVTGKFGDSSSPRLTSFHAARDLSLPGPSSKPSEAKPLKKRIIRPNIVARKTKNEKLIAEALQNHSKTLSKSQQAAFKGKSRGHTKNTLIQTTGTLFEQSSLKKKPTFSTHSSKAHTPVLTPKTLSLGQVKLEPVAENGTDFMSRFNQHVNDANEFDVGLEPINICSGRNKIKEENGLAGNFTQPKVKSEPSEDSNPTNSKMQTSHQQEIPLAEKLLSNTQEYMCFAFPAIVGKGKHEAEERKPDEFDSMLDRMEAASLSGHNRIKLESLDNGRLGSFKIYKSGKVEFVLNSQTFDVSEGSGISSSKLAMVDIDSEKKTGKLSVLGTVPSKYSFCRSHTAKTK